MASFAMRVTFIIGVSALMFGCAKEKGAGDGNNPNPPDSTSGGGSGPIDPPPSTTVSIYGAEATLNISSKPILDQYALRPLVNPTDVKIHVVMDDFGDGKFGGYLGISYSENGVSMAGSQLSTGGNLHDAQYNSWFVNNNKTAFHAFFEDRFGAVILVIDEVFDLGDGSTADLVNGSVFFKNHRSDFPNPSMDCIPFDPTFPCPSNTRCWFVKGGPFDCRAFTVNGKIKTASSIEPSPLHGYIKLGTFQKLSRSQAFSE